MGKDLNEILEDIRLLRIHGATSIAKTVIDALLESKDEIAQRSKDKDEFIANIKDIAQKLTIIRPTETMAQNAVGFVVFELQDLAVNSIEDCKAVLEKRANEVKMIINENENKFIQNGIKLIKSSEKKFRQTHILTHCHSSGVRNVLKMANDEGAKIRVFNTETRPVFQGRITAQKMIDSGIDVTMIIDSAAPFVVSGKSGREFDIDMVLFGSDAITINGAAINKIGSYGISLSAHHENIPLYIVTSLLKAKRGVYNILDIPLEMRPCQEVWPEAPKELKILNFAFDIVPPEFITGFITEFGILKPAEIKDVLEKNYPSLL